MYISHIPDVASASIPRTTLNIMGNEKKRNPTKICTVLRLCFTLIFLNWFQFLWNTASLTILKTKPFLFIHMMKNKRETADWTPNVNKSGLALFQVAKDNLIIITI